jgi:hypothetical protein
LDRGAFLSLASFKFELSIRLLRPEDSGVSSSRWWLLVGRLRGLKQVSAQRVKASSAKIAGNFGKNLPSCCRRGRRAPLVRLNGDAQRPYNGAVSSSRAQVDTNSIVRVC